VSFDPGGGNQCHLTPVGNVYIFLHHPHKSPKNKSELPKQKAMAPRGCRKFDFPGLPADLQDLVISKLAAPEAANLGAASREMRAAAAETMKRFKREHAVAAEARAELFRVLPEILKKPFRDPAPQKITVGKYTVRTSRPTGPSPFYFQLTVADEEMSVEFSIWDSDVRFWEPNGKAVVSQNCLLIGGKKKHFVPEMKKYDSIRKDVADIRNCLKFPGTYHL